MSFDFVTKILSTPFPDLLYIPSVMNPRLWKAKFFKLSSNTSRNCNLYMLVAKRGGVGPRWSQNWLDERNVIAFQ